MIKIGDRAPSFSLQSDSGSQVQLKDFKGMTVILYFYPKDMTPGCTTEASDFKKLFAKFKKKDAVILGVSKDSVASHEKFRKKHTLPFPLLADVDGEVCEAYGVWKEKSLYGKKYMGIERTTFVISPQGKIEAIFPKVKVAGHAALVLESLS
jgi:peroxiredoxin Q/BCP